MYKAEVFRCNYVDFDLIIEHQNRHKYIVGLPYTGVLNRYSSANLGVICMDFRLHQIEVGEDYVLDY
jgi:hypothetical protein